MAKIPLYEQKIQPSGEYQSAEFDPTPIIKGFEVEAETARHMANLAESVGTQLDEFKNKSDEADYEVFHMEKQKELAQLKQQALLDGTESIDTVFENVVAPRMKEIESEVGKRGYAWNTGKYQQRWKMDSQKLAYEEFGDRLELELAEHENKIIREAEAYYKNNDWETGDAKIAQLAGLVGNEKAFEQQQKGRYNFVLNKVTTSNDPDEIRRIMNDKKHMNIVSYAQKNQLETIALGRVKTLIQNKIQPAMSRADKLYRDGQLTQYWIDGQLEEGNITPRIAKYYSSYLATDLERAMSKDLTELGGGDRKKLVSAKKMVDELLEGGLNENGLKQLEKIMDKLDDKDISVQLRTQLMSPVIDMMATDMGAGVMASETTLGKPIMNNKQVYILGHFHKQFNALTDQMSADLREELYLETVFQMDDVIKKVGKIDVDRTDVQATEQAQKQMDDLIFSEINRILKPVRNQAIQIPLKPKATDITVSLDIMDEFFPER